MPRLAIFAPRKHAGLGIHSAILSSNAGSGLVLILVLVTIASITMMGALNIGGVQQKTRTQNIMPFHVQVRRGNILSILTNNTNWRTATALDVANPTMACVNDPYTTCPAEATLPTSPGKPLYNVRTLADAGASTPTYQVGGSNGITISGENCTDFPSESCPVSFAVYWRCTSNCTAYVDPPPPAVPSPPLRTFSIHVTPLYNPTSANGTSSKSMVAFDVSKYDIDNIAVTTTAYAPIGQYFFKP